MTLEMQQRLAGHVAEFVALDGAQRRAARLEAGHVIERGAGVDRHQFIPATAIRFLMRIHGLRPPCGSLPVGAHLLAHPGAERLRHLRFAHGRV